MLENIKSNILYKICCGLMALHLFNMSIDVSELISKNISENPQESILELVVETFLGYEDAFNEIEEGDNIKLSLKKDFSNIWILPQTYNQIYPYRDELRNCYAAFYLAPHSFLFIKNTTPPPEIKFS